MRRFPEAKSLTRSTSQRPPRVEIVIVCEGANTEPRYFEDCARYYGSGTIRLNLITAAGVPMTLVKAAIALRMQKLDEYRRNKDSFDACFRVWAVFDRDEHPCALDAIKLAREYDVDVAFSNPCFELWPILHLKDFGAQLGRHELQSYLTSIMPSYDHKSGAWIDFDQIRQGFSSAYRRAQKHSHDRELENADFGYGNPSTTVGVLVRKIIENGKYANREMLNILDELPPNPSVGNSTDK